MWEDSIKGPRRHCIHSVTCTFNVPSEERKNLLHRFLVRLVITWQIVSILREPPHVSMMDLSYWKVVDAAIVSAFGNVPIQQLHSRIVHLKQDLIGLSLLLDTHPFVGNTRYRRGASAVCRAKNAAARRVHDDDEDEVESKNEKLNSNHNNVDELLKNLQEHFDYQGRLPSYSKVSTTSATTTSSLTSPSSTHSNSYRCGFVAVVGAPNMGKSTLVNALLQEQLCITTHRPQTTRHAILGILTSPPLLQSQVCLVDTPGVISKPAYKLQEGMMEAVYHAFQDADALLIVTDVFSTPIPDDFLFQRVQYLSNTNQKKVIVAINKVDLVTKLQQQPQTNLRLRENIQGSSLKSATEITHETQEHTKTLNIPEAIRRWRSLLPHAMAVIPMSASIGGDDLGVIALRSLLFGGPDVPKAFRDLGRPMHGMFLRNATTITNNEAKSLLPISPPLYEQGTLTDRNGRFFASELIRESLFLKLGKELPYCCEVRIDEFHEPKQSSTDNVARNDGKIIGMRSSKNALNQFTMVRIKASIHVERDSQKGIVIGSKGDKIKEIRLDATNRLEEFFQEKVVLFLFVQVDKDWRRDETRLKDYGYLR